MYKLLGGLKEYLKWQDIVTDNAIFRLHNLFTTVLLLTCSLIITATQYVGNPIHCIVNGLPVRPINTYCWITSTFTMPDAFLRQVGSEVAHPGVANDFGDEDAKKYYTYYQWVCFVLFFQAMLCYTPKWIWDSIEGGLLRTLIMGLNRGLCQDDEKCMKKKALIEYLLRHIKRHNMYALKYWFCETLCLVNIIGQLYLMNHFFDGEFFSYGLRVVAFSEQSQEERVDPMVYVFPRVTKCTFHKYGASGSIQKHDSLCVLPLNIVNEKTYIFLWFWYIILAALLSVLVVYRAVILAVPSVRPILLHARNRMVPKEVTNAICRKTDVGDWWILYMLGRNMDPMIYGEVIADLAKKIETPSSNNP
ncbi:innexin inx1 [Schistocerca americana]|uniref:Innexin inx1 n=1 Tax=Schistocerca americana TaxID=7009 RepID=INX1_SCHAM|nr:innexin inx1 [Schistocerca americana]XP_047102357.1 innexin inx1 [Schistocerca piceifrons]XP_049781093.1 innexin inx1 [Schistocerca cancellata]XP_049805863.1 innexin inx1 [Schistocerca nitens]XP_049953595.1 innexin inx1 [Schistocerca serialis cubense]Q9XYN0.1 RecName: Full=Innexin inx1; Short=Innexin-1; AltName: Full=G-Inx1 [Schistocerca americana]AAD29305.1 innexin-1 [Schistocerca americana]